MLSASRAAVAASRDTESARAVAAELGRLREVTAQLEQRLGPENPLSVDATQAVQAATLVVEELRGLAAQDDTKLGEPTALDAYASVLADARMRFARGAEVARTTALAS